MRYDERKFLRMIERRNAYNAAVRDLSDRRQAARRHWQQLVDYLDQDRRNIVADSNVFLGGRRITSASAKKSTDEKVAARQGEIDSAEAAYRHLEDEYAVAAERAQHQAVLVHNLAEFLRRNRVPLPYGVEV